MIQNLLMLLVVPLCLVLSLPPSAARATHSVAVHDGSLRQNVRRLIASPIAGWLLGAGRDVVLARSSIL